MVYDHPVFQMAGLILIFVAWMPILGFPKHIVGSIPTSGLEHGVYPNSNYNGANAALISGFKGSPPRIFKQTPYFLPSFPNTRIMLNPTWVWQHHFPDEKRAAEMGAWSPISRQTQVKMDVVG